MPLYIIHREMPYDEFVGWQLYFKERPVGWREDLRTYKLMQIQGLKDKPWKHFPTLDPIFNSSKTSSFNPVSFKRSFLFQKLLEAKGGEKVL